MKLSLDFVKPDLVWPHGTLSPRVRIAQGTAQRYRVIASNSFDHIGDDRSGHRTPTSRLWFH